MYVEVEPGAGLVHVPPGKPACGLLAKRHANLVKAISVEDARALLAAKGSAYKPCGCCVLSI